MQSAEDLHETVLRNILVKSNYKDLLLFVRRFGLEEGIKDANIETIVKFVRPDSDATSANDTATLDQLKKELSEYVFEGKPIHHTTYRG